MGSGISRKSSPLPVSLLPSPTPPRKWQTKHDHVVLKHGVHLDLPYSLGVFHDLPDEVLLLIVTRLAARDVVALSACSRALLDLTSDHMIWKPLYQQQRWFSLSPLSVDQPVCCWKRKMMKRFVAPQEVRQRRLTLVIERHKHVITQRDAEKNAVMHATCARLRVGCHLATATYFFTAALGGGPFVPFWKPLFFLFRYPTDIWHLPFFLSPVDVMRTLLAWTFATLLIFAGVVLLFLLFTTWVIANREEQVAVAGVMLIYDLILGTGYNKEQQDITEKYEDELAEISAQISVLTSDAPTDGADATSPWWRSSFNRMLSRH